MRGNMPVACDQEPYDPMRRLRDPVLHAKWSLGVYDELLAMYAIQQSRQCKLQHGVLHGQFTSRARYRPARRPHSRLSSSTDVLAINYFNVEFVRLVFSVSSTKSTLYTYLHSSKLARRLVLQVPVRCHPSKRVC